MLRGQTAVGMVVGGYALRELAPTLSLDLATEVSPIARYATMFAIESLSLAGETYDNSPSVRLACDFLLSKQMEDGGWGESYKVSPLLGMNKSLMLM